MDQYVVSILEKYLDNRCTAEELERVQKILESGRYKEEWEEVLNEVRTQAMSASDTATTLDTRTAEMLLKRIRRSSGILEFKTIPQRKSRSAWTIAAAASIILLLTAGIGVFMGPASFSLWEPDLAEVTTRSGDRTEVILNDGTIIWLDDLSQLRYPDLFNDDTREVHLDGSAFFDVAHDSDRPFLVHTNELTVRVLGTSFGISAYEDDKDVAVFVVSGKVSVVNPSQENTPIGTLLPGEQLAWDRGTHEYRQQTVVIEDANAWKEGKLVFKDKPLGDVARAIERRYGVAFKFEDEKAKEKRITFKQNSPELKDVLKVLCLVTGLEYEMEGKVIRMK